MATQDDKVTLAGLIGAAQRAADADTERETGMAELDTANAEDHGRRSPTVAPNQTPRP